MSTLYLSGAEVLKAYSGDKIVFGSTVNVPWLCYKITLDESPTVRLINPTSHPKYAWENVKHHLIIDWGDGTYTKWYGKVFNSGRFNRESTAIPTHTYNVTIDPTATTKPEFTIKIRCNEPLTPIYCNVISIFGSFPPDDYIVKSSMDLEENPYEVSLFSEKANLNDYPEYRLLSKHKSTIKTLGKDLLLYWENTSMAHKFEGFTALWQIQEGFFDGIINKVKDYSYCFNGCSALESAPINLLGKVNRAVEDMSYMFYDCVKLVSYPGVDVAPNLTTIEKTYMNCISMQTPNVGEYSAEVYVGYEHYMDCPNIINACQTFANCTNVGLPGIDGNFLRNSTKVKTIKGLFMGTNMGVTNNIGNGYKNDGFSRGFGNKDYFKISHMTELEDATYLFAMCKHFGEVPADFIGDAGKNADTFKFKAMFMEAGCLDIKATAFAGLRGRTNLDTDCSYMFSGAHFSNPVIPDNVFKDVFTKAGTTLNSFFMDACANWQDGDYINLIQIGDIFPGCSGVTHATYMLAGIGDEERQSGNTDYRNYGLGYVSLKLFHDMTDLTSIAYLFCNSILEMKPNERLLENNRKIESYQGMFDGAHANFDMPIDYIINVGDSVSKVDLTDMFRDSNIRTYRPFKVTSSKTATYDVHNMLYGSATTVPLEYVVNGRTTTNETVYTPVESCVIYRIVTKDTVIQLAPIENCTFEVSFNDDNSTRYSYAATAGVPLDIQVYRKYSDTTKAIVVKIYSSVAVFPVNTNVLEIDGEFPYKSLEGKQSLVTADMLKSLENVRYIGSDVFGISSITDTIRLYCAQNTYVHPWAMKHNTRLTSFSLFDFDIYNESAESIYGYANLRQLPSKFIVNEDALDMSNSIYYDGIMIPDEFIDAHNVVNVSHMIKSRPYVKDILEYRVNPRKYNSNDYLTNVSEMLDKHYQVSTGIENTVYPVADNAEPDYLLLRFDNGVKEQIYLRSLLGNDQFYPLTFRYRLITETQDVSGSITANSENDLYNALSGYSLYSSTTQTILILYSANPIWVYGSEKYINHVGGVIPECNLVQTFSNLAPNVKTIDETILFRLTNSNFDFMFANTSLTCIPASLLTNNMKNMTSARYMFMNTLIREVPDYLFNNSYLDIDLTGVFSNCNNLSYVRRPFCTSLQGRLILDGAFTNCKCSLVNTSTIFSDVYYKRTYTNGITANTDIYLNHNAYNYPTEVIEDNTSAYATYYTDLDAPTNTDIIYTGQTKANTVTNIGSNYMYLPMLTRISMNRSSSTNSITPSTDRVSIANPRLRELNYVFAATSGFVDASAGLSPIVYSFDTSKSKYYPHPSYFVNNRNLAKSTYMYAGFNSMNIGSYTFNGMDILADGRLPHINDISYMFYGFNYSSSSYAPSIPLDTYPTRMVGLFMGDSTTNTYIDASKFAFTNLINSSDFDSVASEYMLDLTDMFTDNLSVMTVPEDMKYLVKYSGTFTK